MPIQNSGGRGAGPGYSEVGAGTEPGPVQPAFWTGSFLKTSFLDRQKFQ